MTERKARARAKAKARARAKAKAKARARAKADSCAALRNDNQKSKGKSKSKRERATLVASPVWFVEAWELAAVDLFGGEGVAFVELDLVPVGVGERDGAGGVELGDLLGGEVPADGGEVGAELLFVAGADDERADGGALEEPVEGDLRDGLAGFLGERVEGVDDLVDVLPVGDGAGVGGRSCFAGGRLRGGAGRGGSCR